MIEVLTSQEPGAADLVLVSGPPFVCKGSPASCEITLQAMERIRFDAELGQTMDLLPSGNSSQRIVAIGAGEQALSVQEYGLSLGGYIIEAMNKHRVPKLRLPSTAELGGPRVMEAVLRGASLHSFQLEPGNQAQRARFVPSALLVTETDLELAQKAYRCATAVNRARAWVEQPANLLTTPVWVEEARHVLSNAGANVRILGPHELEQMGAGGLVAVARGSEHGPRLLIAEWRGDARRDQWDVVLVGKGLTFDGGGLNLKSQPIISKMKLDMAGGAAVLGALELAISRHSRANIAVLVAVAENSIDALAYRPGDVVTSLSGLTIEVADTDYEGRVVLADALTYAVRSYKPTWLVDVATLTAMAARVLHEEFAALYCSDDQLAHDLIAAGEAVGERLWSLPLVPSQDYLVESEIADVCNTGTPGFFGLGAGSSTAGAKFLEKFTCGIAWAHLDVTGTVWSTRRTARGRPGATGYGVQLLDHWIAALEAHSRWPRTK